ncbi:SGNH/GDSL hydrolase family protein [Alicyclobacillus dauci]|uniref:SGNH/GDSL hydrolase family protein n=1 Tax=Alicyclobacillus dauci TaxID=1475485 RepID=A0ABY6Z1R9_9BACL|nr:SGNH/GDSL hydrolase family protein [Alicyclobacillus dauci]WAH36782.1 SGNH/GDSL hydrolase family protein [Alicyclobacillus dauci]
MISIKKWIRNVAIGGSIATAAVAGFLAGEYTIGGGFVLPSPIATAHAATSFPTTKTQEKVMVVGVSIAHGWKDPNDDSYLKRAFQLLSDSTNMTYQYVNKTIVGGSAMNVPKSEYESWLSTVKPQLVVLSWGFLNDASKNVSPIAVHQAILNEISEALAVHAVVLVVSPPVTKASETGYQTLTNRYVSEEFSAAKSLHNPNVYTLDVLNQMRSYLKAHNQTWQPYFGDSWHPNQVGYQLAGSLLYNDLIETFDQSPIQVKTTGSLHNHM